MTSSSNLDPFEMWRQVVTKLEGGINSMANNSMNSEQFTRALHQFSQVSTGMQQTWTATSRRFGFPAKRT